MEEWFDELADSVSDNISEIIGNTEVDTDAVAADFLDGFSEAAPETVSSLLDGNFNSSDIDFSSLFEDTPDEPSVPIDEGTNYNVSFEGNENAQIISQINEQESRVRDAKNNIEYYKREIRNFDNTTTSNYRSNCISHLEIN